MAADEKNIGDILNQIALSDEEIEALSEDLKDQLIQCGWRDVLRVRCVESAKSLKKGDNVSLEDLISMITPIAQSLVPDNVKADLLKQVQKILDQRVNTVTNNENKHN